MPPTATSSSPSVHSLPFPVVRGKVGLAPGPLIPLLGNLPVEVPFVAVLASGGFGLLAGSWMVPE